MTFDPRDLLAYGDELEAFPATATGPHGRCRISRYYYCALLYVRGAQRVSSPAEPSNRETTHAAVIKRLRELGDPEGTKLEMLLSGFRDLRNRADYGDSIGDLAGQVKTARRWAAQAIQKADMLSSRNAI